MFRIIIVIVIIVAARPAAARRQGARAKIRTESHQLFRRPRHTGRARPDVQQRL